MFKFLQKRKIEKLAGKAIVYCNQKYVAPYVPTPPKKTEVRFSEETPDDGVRHSEVLPDDGVRHSEALPDNGIRHSEEPPQPNIKYSDRGSGSDNRIRFSREEPNDEDDGVRDLYSQSRSYRELQSIMRSGSLSGIEKFMKSNKNLTFVEKMLRYINAKDLRDSYVYKAAQIDRRLFSKMVSDMNYKPSKDTAIAIAFALCLSLEEAQDLLERAGYVLSHSDKRDIVIEFFFRERIFNLDDINQVLEKLSMKLIGRF